MRFIALTMMVVFSFSGVIFLIVSIRELVRRIVRRRHFIRTDGIIVGMRTKTLRTTRRGRLKPTIMHFPVIRFTMQTGESVTFNSETGDTGPKSGYAQGQRLEILYDPKGELGPMLSTWSGVWLPNLMGVVAGIIFLLGAFLIYWAFWERIIHT
ncbi:MAG TPA: DUF3592 domain-containing protein [Blastocatellia bacterium]|nr:DUF3592 domain-containing protein [Blastocatellia bacterium]